ncbi:MAG TPA: hypothetical protein VGM36_04915, partial [Rhizomicrobium sp.]
MNSFAQKAAPWVSSFCLCALACAALIFPLGVLLARSVSGPGGAFTLANYASYFATPGLSRALLNTVVLGVSTVVLVMPLAFIFAYGLERTPMRFKESLSAIASVPLLVPSLLPALALVYLFGHQGMLKALMGHAGIYGLQGVLIADAVATFPHALVILRTALSAADGRLYEQASILGASR